MDGDKGYPGRGRPTTGPPGEPGTRGYPGPPGRYLKFILELAWYISLGGWVIPVGFMTSNWSYFEFSHQIHIDSNCLSQ